MKSAMGSEMVSLAVTVIRSHDLEDGCAWFSAGIWVPAGKITVAKKEAGN
jgi:hypothetical protein